MKKRVFSLTVILLLVLSLTVQAAVRWEQNSPVLEISGRTATCFVDYLAGARDSISVTLSLKENGRRVAGWSDSGVGSVTISEEYDKVEPGNTYELVLNAVINGKIQEAVSVEMES